MRRLTTFLSKLTPLQLIAVAILAIAALVVAILFLVFSESIFAWLVPVAEKWQQLKGGWIILWLMVFVAAFPPMIGYSTLLTLAGFIYGVGAGWPIAATATVAGSSCSFLVCRTVLARYVERLVAQDQRFEALSLVLQHDGLKLLIMIRLCPLPYSLSNGAISTFRTVHVGSFAIATAAATPKLFITLFVGSRLAAIARGGQEKMDGTTKAINWLSIIAGVTLGVVTGWLIYTRTLARSRELEATGGGERLEEGRAGSRRAQSQQQNGREGWRNGRPAHSAATNLPYPDDFSGDDDDDDEGEDDTAHDNAAANTAKLLWDDQVDFVDYADREPGPEAKGGASGKNKKPAPYRDEVYENGGAG